MRPRHHGGLRRGHGGDRHRRRGQVVHVHVAVVVGGRPVRLRVAAGRGVGGHLVRPLHAAVGAAHQLGGDRTDGGRTPDVAGCVGVGGGRAGRGWGERRGLVGGLAPGGGGRRGRRGALRFLGAALAAAPILLLLLLPAFCSSILEPNLKGIQLVI